MRLVRQSDGTTVLYIGAKNWPFPVPLISENGKWRFDLADSAWRVRSGVRSALLTYFLASRNLEALHSEEHVRTAQVKILDERLAVGEIPRPEVDAARIELAKTQLAITAAEGADHD